MKRLLLPLALFLFIILTALPAMAQHFQGIKPAQGSQSLQGEVRAYGLYEVEVVEISHDSGGAGSDVRMTEQQLVETTLNVPLEGGVSFGFDYFIPGNGAVQVTANIVAPNGQHLSGPFPVNLGKVETFSYTMGPTLLPAGPGAYDLYLSTNGQRVVGMIFNLYKP